MHITIIGLMTGFIILSFVFHMDIFIWLAAALGFIALSFPSLARSIAFLWQTGARAVGFFISYVVLTVLFFIVLTPFALMCRFFAHTKPLQLKKKISGSYYVFRDHSFSASDFEKPW